jgi:hypothetical protein
MPNLIHKLDLDLQKNRTGLYSCVFTSFAMTTVILVGVGNGVGAAVDVRNEIMD